MLILPFVLNCRRHTADASDWTQGVSREVIESEKLNNDIKNEGMHDDSWVDGMIPPDCLHCSVLGPPNDLFDLMGKVLPFRIKAFKVGVDKSLNQLDFSPRQVLIITRKSK